MAAKPPQPPGNFLNENNNPTPCATTRNHSTESVLAASNHTLDATTDNTDSKPTTKTNCNCTNISIMHLFHEMKQEFPTIPDTIVTQCVNENCHQRENCVQLLRNELALNPTPAQSYPAKVLHPNNFQKHGPKPLKPLKPARVAPLQPPTPSATAKHPAKNCVSEELKNIFNNNHITTHTKAKDVTSDMPSVVVADKNINSNSHSVNEPQQNDGHKSEVPQLIAPPPRVRPTTLNLHGQPQQQQQLQRQQLNVQLQQHFQQRQQHKGQRPLRKAPLPPVPPKPAQFNGIQRSPTQAAPPAVLSQQSSFSNDSSNLTSPLSSAGESEISVDVSLSSPTAAPHQNHHQLKSPVRVRSVITVQPEAPYTRDFLMNSPTSSGGSGTNQKSYTSVNFTLRQPTANAAVPQSTIDISAGPGLSGAGGGLTYSSTSYDARRGCQKNFHITVSDERGVFSASRIRPRSCVYPGEQEADGAITGDGGVNPLRSTASEQSVLRHQHLSQPQQNIVASNNRQYGDMCLPREPDELTAKLQRQKQRRDKLANALRDNKKRLNQVNTEFYLLTEPVNPGESERLDNEIQRLRSECQIMLNEIENARRSGDYQHANPRLPCRQPIQQAPNTQDARTLPLPPQPFPRQRPPRPPPPLIARQTDFIQHHMGGNPTTSPIVTSPADQSGNHYPTSPPTYQQYYQQYQQQSLPSAEDEEEYSDSNTDCEDEEPWACSMCTVLNHPQLNICEICENVRIQPGTVRILHAAPNAAAAGATSVSVTPANVNANASLEHDANLTQQQLQQFALHT